MRPTSLTAVALGLVLLLLPSVARGAPFGADDTTFSGDGWTVLTGGRSTETRFLNVLKLPGGAGFISVGSLRQDGGTRMLIARQDAQGKLVTSFGDQGATSIDAGNGHDAKLFAAARQEDGKLVAAGSATQDGERRFAVARFTAEGQIDGGFGNGGVAIVAVGDDGDSYAQAVAVGADGRILAAGAAKDGAATKFALLRLGPDGKPDTTLSEDGTRTYAIGTSATAISREVRAEPGGGATMLGTASFGAAATSEIQGATLRVTSSGARDTAYGDGGQTLTKLPTRSSGFGAFTWDGQGRILLAGRSTSPRETYGVDEWADLARLTPDGRPDTSFGGGDGLVDDQKNTGYDDIGSLTRLAILDDGSVAAIGGTTVGSAPILSAVSSVLWKPDGALDPDYGSEGAMAFQLGSGQTTNDADSPGGIAADAAGIVFNGAGARTIQRGFLDEDHFGRIVRFSPTGYPTASFGSSLAIGQTPRTAGMDAITLADGSVVVAGQAAVDGAYRPAVWKLGPDGEPDQDFGDHGIVISGQGLAGFFKSVAEGEAGKLWIAGAALDDDYYNRMLVVRLNADGSFDSSFDGDGVRLVQVSSGPFHDPVCTGTPSMCRDDDGIAAGDAADADQIVALPDGEALLVGHAGTQDLRDETTDRRLALVRLNDDGSLDGAFGTGGVVQIYREAAFSESLPNAAVLDGGKLVVAARLGYDQPSYTTQLVLLRFDPATGALDPAFDTDGGVFYDWPAAGFQEGMARVSDGYRVWGDAAYPGTGYWLSKLDSGGALDTSYGSNGFVDVAAAFPEVKLFTARSDLVELPGGRLVGAAGPKTFQLVGRAPMTFAVDLAGAPVADFGTGGVLSTARSCGRYSTAALAVDGSGRLLVIGNGSDPAIGSTVSVSRYVDGVPSTPVLCPPQGTASASGTGPYTCNTSFSGSQPITFSYQWIREKTPIAGATEKTYAGAGEDAGHLIACRVLASNAFASRKATSNGLRASGDPYTEPDDGAGPGITPTPTPTPTPTATPTPAPGGSAPPGGAPGSTAPPSRTPAPPAPAPALVSGWPSTKKCVSKRSFRIRIRAPQGAKLVSGVVFVNAKKVKALKGKRLTAPIDLRGLPKGRFTIKVTAKTSAGKTITESRRYKTCAKKRAGKG